MGEVVPFPDRWNDLSRQIDEISQSLSPEKQAAFDWVICWIQSHEDPEEIEPQCAIALYHALVEGRVDPQAGTESQGDL